MPNISTLLISGALHLARGILGVARGLLVLLARCNGRHLGNALGVFAGFFFRHSACLPGFLSRAFCLPTFCGDLVRVLAFGRADLARCFRFHPRSLPLDGLCIAAPRRCLYLFKLRLLRPGRRLQALREVWIITRHVYNLSFQSSRIGG